MTRPRLVVLLYVFAFLALVLAAFVLASPARASHDPAPARTAPESIRSS